MRRRGHLSPAKQAVPRAHPETGSAGRPPEQPLAFSRTARTAVADSHRHSLLAGRRGRTVVDIAPSGNGCADTLGDDLLDDHDAFTSFATQPHLITGPYDMRGLDPHAVDPDMPGAARTGRGRAGPGQPHRPDPGVHPPGLITCHSATVIRYALAGSPAGCLPRTTGGFAVRSPEHPRALTACLSGSIASSPRSRPAGLAQFWTQAPGR
jgi:hypothetical protein